MSEKRKLKIPSKDDQCANINLAAYNVLCEIALLLDAMYDLINEKYTNESKGKQWKQK